MLNEISLIQKNGCAFSCMWDCNSKQDLKIKGECLGSAKTRKGNGSDYEQSTICVIKIAYLIIFDFF